MLLRTVFLGPNLQNIVRQIYDIWKVYDKCTIKRDLQKILRQSYNKRTTAHQLLYDSIKHTCSNYIYFLLVYNSHIVP